MQFLTHSNSLSSSNTFNYTTAQDQYMQLPVKRERSTTQLKKLSSLLWPFSRSNPKVNVEFTKLEEPMIASEELEEALANFLTFEEQIERLQSFYTFRNSEEVHSFLEANKFLVPLLLIAPSHLREYFPNAKILLEVEVDPEEDHQELAVHIVTSMSAEQAFQQMEQFEQMWWLDASDQAQLKLEFYVEFE